MILFASKRTLQNMTRRAESAESDIAYWKALAEEYLNALTETDAQCDLLLDAADNAVTGIDLLTGIARQQEDEIARLSTDLALANNGIEALTQERDRLSDDLATVHSDLALAYQTRDEAMLQIGTQKKDYEAQLKDRDERIAELEAKLLKLDPPRKRQSKAKTEPPANVAESEATA